MTLDEQIRALVRDLVRDELRKLAPAPSEYLTAREAAQLAKVAPATIRRWIREGKLAEHRAGRVVRVRRDELDALMRGERREDMTPEARADLDFERRYGR